MKAAVVTRFGKNWSFEVRELPRPEPAPGELLVRVRAATVNRTDCGELRHPWIERLITRGAPARPVLGLDFAGEVEAIGASVSAFKAGDRVFGMAPRGRNGAQADYLCVPEAGPVATLPDDSPFESGPVCEGAYYANASLSHFGVGPGHRILVYGASGAIGSAAVQLAKARGAEVVAAVDGPYVERIRMLGADRVVDRSSEAFRKLGPSFDFILDAVGKMRARQWRPLLRPDGRFATTDIGPSGQSLMLLVWSLITRSGQVTVPVPKRGTAPGFVHSLQELMAAGQFRALVDRKYPLGEIAEAYRYVQSERKLGIVVIEP